MTFASTANPAIGTRGPDLGLGGGVWSGASRDTQGHTYYLVVGCLVSCVSPRRIPSGCERASRAPLELETRAPELFFLRKVETRTSLAHSQCRVVALGNWYEALLRTGSIDLKTVLVILVRNLWRPREIGEVSPRAPHRGPTTRSVTATFAMPMSG